MIALPANIGNPLAGQTVAGYIEIDVVGINPDVIGPRYYHILCKRAMAE